MSGGKVTFKKYGSAHFAKMGEKGGQIGGSTTYDRYGPDHYKKIGAKGGRAGTGAAKVRKRQVKK